MSDFNYQYLDTPIGQLRLLSNGEKLLRIEFEGQHGSDGVRRADPVLEAARRQLREYFAGRRKRFELPLAVQGTDFQRRVWKSLRQIPFGELRSYRDIADAIGNRKAVRAVGGANGRNPVPIVVPCHRVIGGDGGLTGFGGGLATKRALLDLEGALSPG